MKIWQTVSEMRGKKSTSIAKLKTASQIERMQKWKECFKNLLGNLPKVNNKPKEKSNNSQLDIKLVQITEEEPATILKKIKSQKAAGLNKIPPEFFGLVWFYNISTIVSYLMPNPF